MKKKSKKKTPVKAEGLLPYWYIGILASMFVLAGAVLVSK